MAAQWSWMTCRSDGGYFEGLSAGDKGGKLADGSDAFCDSVSLSLKSQFESGSGRVWILIGEGLNSSTRFLGCGDHHRVWWSHSLPSWVEWWPCQVCWWNTTSSLSQLFPLAYLCPFVFFWVLHVSPFDTCELCPMDHGDF